MTSRLKHSQRRRTLQKFFLEALEPRRLFHAGHLHAAGDLAYYPAATEAPDEIGSAAAAAATHPLSDLPVLNSLPGAAASLYLDFDGYSISQWGSYSNANTPVFDVDGDATTFSDSELSTMQAIWRQVAEDYAPFNVNVTTVQPASFANRVAMRVAIGGDGAWLGATAGGVAYVNSFTNSQANSVFVFPKNLGNGHARYVGEAVSHEAGHSFGLQHQSSYTGTQRTAEYYAGPGDGRAPIMGLSYYTTRGLWWNGTSTSSTNIQDDLTVIARSTNGFGYRADDHADQIGSATALAISAGQLSAAGIIGRTDDQDYFSFETEAGQVSLQVQVPSGINNLDATLQLRDAVGTVIAAAAPTNQFGASIAASLTAGAYYLVVGSQGTYGDVGQYTINGSIVPTPTLLVGDMNDDGIVDNFDIQPFEMALTDAAAYLAIYELTDYQQRGDADGDGAFNNFDIGAFEGLLGQSSAAAELPPADDEAIAVIDPEFSADAGEQVSQAMFADIPAGAAIEVVAPDAGIGASYVIFEERRGGAAENLIDVRREQVPIRHLSSDARSWRDASRQNLMAIASDIRSTSQALRIRSRAGLNDASPHEQHAIVGAALELLV